MPHIENVEISATKPTGDLPDVGCGLAEWPHFESVACGLKRYALRYRAPMSCNRLPTLKIDDGNYGNKILVGNQRTLSGPIEELTKSEEPLRYVPHFYRNQPPRGVVMSTGEPTTEICLRLYQRRCRFVLLSRSVLCLISDWWFVMKLVCVQEMGW